MKIVVTGATGDFGRMLTDLLLPKMPPEDLILITRNPQKLAHLSDKGVDVRRGDFDDPETLPDALRGAEKMLLISTARVGRRVAQHKNAIDAAVKAGIKHISYTSSIGIDPNNPAIVIADHLKTEELIKASGLPYAMLRDAHYAEAMVTLVAPMAVETGKWYSACGDGKMALVSQKDCVASAAGLLTTEGHDNKIYSITGPELMTYAQVAELAAEVSGKPVDYVEVSYEERYEIFDALGIPRDYTDDMNFGGVKWCSNDMVTYEQGIHEGYFEVISDDVEMLTGKKPRSVRDVYMEHIDLFR